MTSTDLTLEEQTEEGDTALTLAAEAGLVDNVGILLQHGASPHNTNSRNESPLLIGSKTQHTHRVTGSVRTPSCEWSSYRWSCPRTNTEAINEVCVKIKNAS